MHANTQIRESRERKSMSNRRLRDGQINEIVMAVGYYKDTNQKEEEEEEEEVANVYMCVFQ